MAGTKNHGPQIEDDRPHERPRDQGSSTEEAARLAHTGSTEAGERSGGAAAYEDWSRDDLYEKAKQVGIEGRSRMSKKELISALRHH